MSLKNHIVWRVGVVYLGIFALSLGIIGKLFILIYVEGSKWEEKAEEHNMKYVTIDPNRGDILADDGRLLASSVPYYEIRMDLMSTAMSGELFREKVDSLAFCLSKLFNDKIKIELEDSLAGLSPEKKVILFAVSVFQRIDELGNNSDYRWFLSLNRLRLIRFVRELVDIWCYRANISPIVKRNICPPTGNPFIGLNINNIDLPILKLKKKILLVLNNFVVKGIDRDSKTLGALYILTALTLVSKEAAEARPELYQSATYNTNL